MKKNLYTLVLALGVLLVTQLAIAAPGNTSQPPINPGNASQRVPGIHVGNTGLDIGFDAAQLGADAEFSKLGSTLGIFGNFFATGTTWLGSSTTPWVVLTNGGLGQATLPEYELNIDGTLLAESLAHDPDPAKVPLCVGQEGILFLCEAGIPSASWQVGAWGDCTGGERTRTVVCMQGGSVVDDSQCTPPAPASTASCSDGQCQSFPSGYSAQPADASNGCLAGTYEDTADTSTDWQWQCAGDNGGTTDSCSATIADPVRYMCQSNGSWGTIGTCDENDTNPTYNSSNNYGSGSIVCSTSTPSNQTCNGTVSSYQCQVSGNWSQTGTCSPSDQYPTYSSTSSYVPDDLVCSASTPNNGTCSGSETYNIYYNNVNSSLQAVDIFQSSVSVSGYTFPSGSSYCSTNPSHPNCPNGPIELGVGFNQLQIPSGELTSGDVITFEIRYGTVSTTPYQKHYAGVGSSSSSALTNAVGLDYSGSYNGSSYVKEVTHTYNGGQVWVALLTPGELLSSGNHWIEIEPIEVNGIPANFGSLNVFRLEYNPTSLGLGSGGLETF